MTYLLDKEHYPLTHISRIRGMDFSLILNV